MPTRQVNRLRKVQRGTTQNRRNAISTNPQQNLSRHFIFQEQVSLDNATGTNTIHQSYKDLNPLSMQGFSTIARTFDQYRIRRIRVFCNNVFPLVEPGGASLYRNQARLPRNSNPSVNIMTAIDHTPGVVAGPDIYAYNNVQFRVPDNDFGTKIADYTPRMSTTDNQELVRPTNNFLSTTATTPRWTGFQLYIVNTGANQLNSPWANPTYQQKYLLRYEVTVEFKQPIYQNSSTITAPPNFAGIEHSEREETTPERESSAEAAF